jgi:small basic protein
MNGLINWLFIGFLTSPLIQKVSVGIQSVFTAYLFISFFITLIQFAVSIRYLRKNVSKQLGLKKVFIVGLLVNLGYCIYLIYFIVTVYTVMLSI